MLLEQPLMKEEAASLSLPAGICESKRLIFCAHLGAKVHKAFALDDVLDNDVKNADETCAHCPNQCFN